MLFPKEKMKSVMKFILIDPNGPSQILNIAFEKLKEVHP